MRGRLIQHVAIIRFDERRTDARLHHIGLRCRLRLRLRCRLVRRCRFRPGGLAFSGFPDLSRSSLVAIGRFARRFDHRVSSRDLVIRSLLARSLLPCDRLLTGLQGVVLLKLSVQIGQVVELDVLTVRNQPGVRRVPLRADFFLGILGIFDVFDVVDRGAGKLRVALGRIGLAFFVEVDGPLKPLDRGGLVAGVSESVGVGEGQPRGPRLRTCVTQFGKTLQRDHSGVELPQIPASARFDDRQLDPAFAIEPFRLTRPNQIESPLRTAEATLTIRHDRQIRIGARHAPRRTQVAQSLGVLPRPICRDARNLADDPDAGRETTCDLGMLVRGFDVVAGKSPFRRDHVLSHQFRKLQRKGTQPVEHLAVEFVRGDVGLKLGQPLARGIRTFLRTLRLAIPAPRTALLLPERPTVAVTRAVRPIATGVPITIGPLSRGVAVAVRPVPTRPIPIRTTLPPRIAITLTITEPATAIPITRPERTIATTETTTRITITGITITGITITGITIARITIARITIARITIARITERTIPTIIGAIRTIAPVTEAPPVAIAPAPVRTIATAFVSSVLETARTVTTT
ncbi:hypothetical protein SAMN05421505_1074 [Sinosporangium album]|uniref:Uncharacterized protein n=1 Tax=Sinosporangium album TaxID=504805 RepID=A0A1G7WF69_9ACTN|nr:hypothetical protein SAMN05421505_1074 [Sinosporangium album]